MKKIMIALSGGVDSAVSAWLLQQQGYLVKGIYMRTWMHEEGILADCPWQDDMQSARSVANHLGIEFEVINMINHYQDHVVRELIEGYKHGITPNPDIICNQHIKFGALLDYALKQGYMLATGHYVQKKEIAPNTFHLLESPQDSNHQTKDQSYFLCFINKEALPHILFPIGHMTKDAVRQLAHTLQLPNANRKDSQGICFLGKVPINDFLKHYIPDNPGPIINHQGKTVGTHQGLHRYTLGQRKGIQIPSNTDHQKYVVTKKDYTTNTLYIAFDNPTLSDLYTHTIQVHRIQFLDTNIDPSTITLAKPRFRDPSTPIQFTYLSPTHASIVFQYPQRALAPGQAIAFYNDTRLLGGAYYC